MPRFDGRLRELDKGAAQDAQILTLDFEQVDFFLQQGENAARESLPELKALADSLNRISSIAPVEPAAEKDSVLGPVELTLMGGAHRKALMYFNLGYKF